MNTIRDKALLFITGIFLVGPIALGIATGAGAALPDWFTSVSAEYLTGKAPDHNVVDNLNFDGYKSRELQASIEDEAGSNIPCKASVLLGNAAIQRSVIEQANVPFRWRCYPTFFGSSYAYVPDLEAAVALPRKRTDWVEEAEASFASSLRELARAYPEKRFVVYIPPMSDGTPLSPAVGLTANSSTIGQTLETMKASGDIPKNLFFLTTEYENADDYYSEFFRSDHHWNILGAEHAYDNIACVLGFDKLSEAPHISFDAFRYTGAYGRSGLIDIEEAVYDTERDRSTFTVEQDDGKREPYRHALFDDSPLLRKRYSFYDTYYAAPYGCTLKNSAGSGSALLLCDSFGCALLPCLGEHYAETFNYPQLSTGNAAAFLDDGTRVSQLIDELDCDDIFFVCHAGNLTSIATNYPDYLDVH